MSSKQQILEIEPATELRFIGPFGSVVTTELVLNNPTNDRVLFKIKTTAPRRYCVRPNSGHIGPQDKAIITIMLQPQDFDPAAERGKHKFMVQSCVAPADFTESAMDQVWKETPTDRIGDTRIKCTFVDDDSAVSAGLGTEKSSNSQNSIRETDRETNGTRRPNESEADNAKSASNQPNVAAASDNGPQQQQQQLAAENEQLRNQLAKLQEQHTQLRQSELRLRSVAAQSSVEHPTSTQPAQAVSSTSPPAKMVAIAVVIALLLGLFLGRFVI